MRPFIAVDWGTTNRRVYRIGANGSVEAREHDGHGVVAMHGEGYSREAGEIAARHGGLPMLCAGMVGSTIGWQAVPYVSAPAGAAALARGVATVAPGVMIVPGVADQAGAHADVMRGEEAQLIGAVSAGLAPPDAMLVQPGTHCKWVRMHGGEIASFTTALTGELFALLRGGGVLAGQIAGPAADGPAFRAGVEKAKEGDLLAALFGIRAAGLLGRLPAADAPSFASGLLIGSDVAARLQRIDDDTIYLLADPVLGALYAAAIAAHGRRACQVESEVAFLAGMKLLWSLMQ